MKAIFLTEDRKILLEDVPRPVISGENQVLVRVRAVGICGSDVHYFVEGRIGTQVVTDRIILGHECSGEVVEVGSGVKNLRAGDRVAIEPGISCGKCQFCQQGKPNLCPYVLFLGTPPVDGALREFLVMPEHNLIKIPKDLGYEEAAICEPLAIGLYAVRISCFRPGDSVAILGAGPIGLSVIFSLAGVASRVVVSDLFQNRLDMAKVLGATETVLVEEGLTGNPFQGYRQDFDVVFEAAGKKETCKQAIEIAKIGGNVVLIGIPRQDIIFLDPHLMRRKELILTNVRRSAHTTEKALHLMTRKPGLFSRIITHTFTLEETEKALTLVSGYRDGVIKAMVKL